MFSGKKEGVLVVGVLNHRNPGSAEARERAKAMAIRLKAAGVNNFQIDAAFEDLLN